MRDEATESIYCPECKGRDLDVVGDAQVNCTVDSNGDRAYWSRWTVMDAADLTEVTCNECDYQGRPKEFGL